jgi:putative phosphoribosyl transferase
MPEQHPKGRNVIISEGLEGDLTIPSAARAIVLFGHGSGSTKNSSRNRVVADVLNNRGMGTLLLDLLNHKERLIDEETKHLRYNIELLARRFAAATEWLTQLPETTDLAIGYFGSSTGAAAALIAAGRLNLAKAIVTRGGRTDLASNSLREVQAPTLLISGGNDMDIISINRKAIQSLNNAEVKEHVIIPYATHLFDEPGKMDEVAQITADWFECFLLRTTKNKLENRHNDVMRPRFFSSLRKRSAFQIKFKDRFAAGEMLASVLGRYKNDRDGVTVIGIARGGIVVSDPIAEKLNAAFDVIVSRKLRSPRNSENAIGAIMQDGSEYLDIYNFGNHDEVSAEYIDREKSERSKEIARRLSIYRPHAREYKVRDRTVILVDDGIATGATIIVAARWLRKQKPKRMVIAAPVAHKQVIDCLKKEADQIEVIRTPSEFKTVEQFYHEFFAPSDDQILGIVKRRFPNC